MESREWPQEIVDAIVDCVIGPYHPDIGCLIPLTLVSRRWNLAVGRRVREACSVRNNPGEVDWFEAIYSSSRCQQYLRSLTFRSTRAISIPTTRDGAGLPNSFSVDISRTYFGLFRQLLVTMNNLFDHERHGDLALRVEPGVQRNFVDGPSNPNRLNVFFVPFEAGMKLPTVPAVTDLFLSGDEFEGPAVHPELALLILRACPKIKTVEWRTGSPPLSKVADRQDHWRALCTTIIELRGFTNLTSLTLIGQGYTPENHGFRPVTVHMSRGGDCVNKQLHLLIKNLKVLILEEWMISPDLFLPQEQDLEDHWGRLQTLRIHALGFAPNGDWYFYGHHSPALAIQTSHLISNLQGGDPWAEAGLWPTAMWRLDIRPQTMNPLVETMSQALLRMNNLEKVILRFEDRNLPRGFLFTCLSAQEKGKCGLPITTTDKTGTIEYFGNWDIPTSITDCWRELKGFSYRHWPNPPTDSDDDDDINGTW